MSTLAVHPGVPDLVVRARLHHADLRHVPGLRRLHRARTAPQLCSTRKVSTEPSRCMKKCLFSTPCSSFVVVVFSFYQELRGDVVKEVLINSSREEEYVQEEEDAEA